MCSSWKMFTGGQPDGLTGGQTDRQKNKRRTTGRFSRDKNSSPVVEWPKYTASAKCHKSFRVLIINCIRDTGCDPARAVARPASLIHLETRTLNITYNRGDYYWKWISFEVCLVAPSSLLFFENQTNLEYLEIF